MNITNCIILTGISAESFYNKDYSEGCVHLGILGAYLALTCKTITEKIPQFFHKKFVDIYYYNDKVSKAFTTTQRQLINLLPDSLPEPDLTIPEEILKELDEDIDYESTVEKIRTILKEKLPGTSFIKAQKKINEYLGNCRLEPVNKYTPSKNDGYHIFYVSVYDLTWKLDNEPNNNTLILEVF